MSEQDSFINEVSEEVRRDKLFKLFKKYGWIPVTLIVLVVGGATVFEIQNARQQAAAEAAGDAVLEALQAPDPAARAVALAELEIENASGQAAVAAFLKADAEIGAELPSDAIATLDALAANSETPAIYRDLAVLKSVILSAGLVPPAERIARLDAIALPNAPFRLLALEQIALAEVEAGNVDAALTTLRGLLLEANVTPGLRQRVQQLIVSLGGTIAAI